MQTNAPIENFIYDFEKFRFLVHDEWREVLAHSAEGKVLRGSLADLTAAFAEGCEVKVAIRNLCADLSRPEDPQVEHEVFVHVGSCYHYPDQGLFLASSHPLVRVRPAVPLVYSSHGWDFGWLMPRSDGFVARWLVNPYTLQFEKSQAHHALRWFVR